MQLIQRASSALFYLKKNISLSQLQSIMQQANQNQKNYSLNHKTIIMIMLSQLYHKNVINFGQKVSQFLNSFYKQNFKDNQTETKRKRQRKYLTTTKKRKKQILKERQNQGMDLQVMLEKQLQRNSNTISQIQKLIKFVSPKRSQMLGQQIPLLQNFPNQIHQTSIQQLKKKVIGSYDIYQKTKKMKDQTKKKKKTIISEKVKHFFHEDIEYQLREQFQRQKQLDLTFQKTKRKKNQQVFDFQFINKKIQCQKPLSSLITSKDNLKLFDKQKIKHRYQSQNLGSNQNVYSTDYFSQNTQQKNQYSLLKSQMILQQEFLGNELLNLQQICLGRKFSKKQKAHIFYHILNYQYKLDQIEPFGPILIQKY